MSAGTHSLKLTREVYWLLLLAFVALVIIYIFDLDFYFADLIYQPTNNWQYKDAWLTAVLMHKYGKYTLILLYIILLVQFFFDYKNNQDRDQSYGKVVLLISLLSGAFSVTLLKQLLEVDCPWDLRRYGGDKLFFPLFQYASASLPSSHCFPSGHASTGFTWFSWYFYSCIYYPKYKLRILTVILFIGFLYGAGQQLRGAHFMSHDIWSILVCLTVNIVIYKLAFRSGAEIKKYKRIR